MMDALIIKLSEYIIDYCMLLCYGYCLVCVCHILVNVLLMSFAMVVVLCNSRPCWFLHNHSYRFFSQFNWYFYSIMDLVSQFFSLP